MKKIMLLSIIILSSQSLLYSKNLGDTSSVEKTGWLVYYLGHVIWFESDITKDGRDKSFFTAGKKYQNGLIVDYNGDANSFKQIAKCYSIMSLTNIDTVTNKGEYAYKETLCV